MTPTPDQDPAPLGAPPLTVEAIYSVPDPQGATYSYIGWSPDGKLVTYLRSENNRTKICAYDVAADRRSEIFDFANLPVQRKLAGVLQVRDPIARISTTSKNRIALLNRALDVAYMWAPGGKSMLLASPDDGPLFLLDLATNHVTPFPLMPAPIYDFRFSPDGRLVSFGCGYNVWAVELATLRTFPLTWGGTEELRNGTSDTVGELLGAQGHWWAPDSSRLACLFTDERAVTQFPLQDPLSFSGSLTTGRYPLPGQPVVTPQIFVSGPRGVVWVDTAAWPGWLLATVNWLPDSRHLALQFLNRDQNRLVLLFADADTGQTFPVLEDSDPSWINACEDLRFFAKSHRFLWSSEKGSYRQLYLYDAKGKVTRLTSGNEASAGLQALDEKNGAVYYLAYPAPFIDGHVKRVGFKVHGERVEVSRAEDLTPTPGVHLPSFGPGCAYFVDYVSTANQPPRLDLCSSDGAKVAVIEGNDHSLYRQLEAAKKVPQFEFVTNIKAAKIGDPSDDMPLIARIMKPLDFSEDNKYPALVYVYGGPNPGGEGLYRVAVNYWVHAPDLWLRVMASLGFVVFSIDNRGSNAGPRGHAFETPLYRRLGTVELQDQLAGVQYLESLPYIDKDRIGIFGGSYGGFLSLSALIRSGGVYKAAAAFAPVTDWRGYDAIYTERYMGQPGGNVKGYDNALLTTTEVLAGLPPKGKLLLLHGADDDNVHLVHSMQLLKALTDSDLACELMVYPGAQHNTPFSYGNTAATLFMRLTGFFMQHLAGEKAPAAAAAAAAPMVL